MNQQFMPETQRIDKLLEWAQKATRLRKKYEDEKHSLLVSLPKTKKAFIISKSNTEDLQQTSQVTAALSNIVERKQLPLYNNLVNYANMAMGTLARTQNQEIIQNIEPQIKLFVRYGEQIRNLLQQQSQVLRQITTKHYVPEIQKDLLTSISKQWKQEQKLVKQMTKEIYRAQKRMAKNLSDMIAWLNNKSYQFKTFYAEHKTLFVAIEFSAKILLVAGLVAGSPFEPLAGVINHTSYSLRALLS